MCSAKNLRGVLLKRCVANTQSGCRWAYAAMVLRRIGSGPANWLAGAAARVSVADPNGRAAATPETGRVVIACAAQRRANRAAGDVRGRVLFPVGRGELPGPAERHSRTRATPDASTASTLVLMWQEPGSADETWGRDSRTRVVQCPARGGSSPWWTTRADGGRVSKTAGRYTGTGGRTGVRSVSASRAAWSRGSRKPGTNQGLSEQARELIRPDEVRTRMRADEAIIFRRGAPPLRCGRAITSPSRSEDPCRERPLPAPPAGIAWPPSRRSQIMTTIRQIARHRRRVDARRLRGQNFVG